ncbi:MAG: PIG-L family deacetylase [Pseudomonadota bacterium]
MPTADQARILEQRAHPKIWDLWRALRPLKSTVRFMNSGAHPDDEISDMLAAISLRDGLNLTYACSTRGEGGQNDIGTEAGADLGALRTREMERAATALGMRLYWHSDGPDDTITDFGFSKSGVETLGKWNAGRTLARFVDIVRRDRPDILCPTFLDVPGQHGHHRAMTEAAHLVMEAAADPAFASNLPSWQVKKLYLPAWSGAGQAYDDDLPPPEATLTIPGDGTDPVSGWTWAQIGQQSRVFHRTQGMGNWASPKRWRDWPLHLVLSHVEGPDTTLTDGLAATVGDLADIAGSGSLDSAQSDIDAALSAFPDTEAVARHAAAALTGIRQTRDALSAEAQAEIGHKLADKETQLQHVLRISLDVHAAARADRVWLSPGDTAQVTLETHPGAAKGLSVDLVLPEGWSICGENLQLEDTTPPSDPYRDTYDPLDPPAPSVLASFTAFGAPCAVRVPMERPPVALATPLGEITPAAMVLNRQAQQSDLVLSVQSEADSDATLALPAGWTATPGGGGLTLTPPEAPAPGLTRFPLSIGGQPAYTARRIDHRHVDPTAVLRPAACDLTVIDVALPPSRVGYIGGGNDRVGFWLRTLGMDVLDLSPEDLDNDGILGTLDAVVIGIFALRFREGLAERMPRLHAWVEGGGTLLTLYHRPWDNWNPATSPPARLEIGQPSLRWRVTDEAATVTLLADHPLLKTPNVITADDWSGWVKERGLYFAKSWDAAYTPLLEMADPGEAPHRGALLVADIGDGRHIHTSLILHHQMERLVPGAFRLMANFLARRP